MQQYETIFSLNSGGRNLGQDYGFILVTQHLLHLWQGICLTQSQLHSNLLTDLFGRLHLLFFFIIDSDNRIALFHLNRTSDITYIQPGGELKDFLGLEWIIPLNPAQPATSITREAVCRLPAGSFFKVFPFSNASSKESASSSSFTTIMDKSYFSGKRNPHGVQSSNAQYLHP